MVLFYVQRCKIYDQLAKDDETVDWSHIIQYNAARPRAVVCLWLVYHRRLATKSRLKRLGLLQEDVCSLCNEQEEDIDHLMLNCGVTKHVWPTILDWLEVKHKSGQWQVEKKWVVQNTKGKGYHSYMLKIAIAETVYGLWMYRNKCVFGTDANEDATKIVPRIIDSIVYRGWLKVKYRKRIGLLMM
ncbi:uncharacterized protein LOC131628357 [Vicia villosa]|uniref:uncharacterized protein LOC131628357 n=1 Tax=Vicia villosa TaxID=3911 RepID=UPI00273C29DE|nr:uncharacterized protein LOC131628357 [Vicia villosa]